MNFCETKPIPPSTSAIASLTEKEQRELEFLCAVSSDVEAGFSLGISETVGASVL